MKSNGFLTATGAAGRAESVAEGRDRESACKVRAGGDQYQSSMVRFARGSSGSDGSDAASRARPEPTGGRSGVTQESDVALVARALDGDAAARHALVLRLLPVVQRRVCRPLASFGAARAHRVERHEVLDLSQQVLLLLFDKGSRVLRAWDPSRGLSLLNFVGLVAEREAKAILRSGRRSAWAENATSDEDLAGASRDERTLEDDVVSREELAKIWHRLEQQLSPRGIELFRALLIEQLSIEEVAETFDMSHNALYTFRSRLRRQVHEIRQELAATDGPAPASAEASAEASASKSASASPAPSVPARPRPSPTRRPVPLGSGRRSFRGES
jgi:RNA polymerase sigma-70 factor (ECF subfamily)